MAKSNWPWPWRSPNMSAPSRWMLFIYMQLATLPPTEGYSTEKKWVT